MVEAPVNENTEDTVTVDSGGIVIEVVSPEEQVLEMHGTMVILPGREGALGVLAGHAPMIVELGLGTVEVHQGSMIREQVFIEGGYVDITGKKCTVLADDATVLSTVDVEQLNDTITTMERTLASATVDSVREGAEAKLLRARAMKRAIEGFRGATVATAA